jgi:hypothetical protein
MNTLCRSLTAATLVLAIAGGCVLVSVHAEYAHGSAATPDDCMVCSWAKHLSTVALADPPVVTGCPVGRTPLPSLPIAPPSSCPLTFSARAPPEAV